MTNRTGLAGQTAADDRAIDVELLEPLGHQERLIDDHAQNRAGEIDRNVLAVDFDLAAPRLDPDAGDGVLALAGGIGPAEGIALRLDLLDDRDVFDGVAQLAEVSQSPG